MAKNKWVDEDGNFIEPPRKAGEPRDVWQKRVEKAMFESGLFPRLNYAKTLKERSRTRQNKIRQNKIDKGQARLDELQAAEGTSGEYAAGLQISKVKEGILKNRQALSPEYADPNYEKSWEEDVKGYDLYAEEAEEKNLIETGQYNLGDTEEGGSWGMSDIDFEVAKEIQEAKKNLLTVTQAGIKKREIAESGNKAYTTNFQEAMRHANKTQAWEDTINTDAPLEKSNVFTIDPDTGLPLGVMTRNQRRAWDEANAKRLAQAEMDKNPEYKDPTDGSDTPKEWTTDDPIVDPKLGTKLGDGLKNIGDASNPKISFKPAKDNEDE